MITTFLHLAKPHRLILHRYFLYSIPIAAQFFLIRQKGMIYRHTAYLLYLFVSQHNFRLIALPDILPQRIVLANISYYKSLIILHCSSPALQNSDSGRFFIRHTMLAFIAPCPTIRISLPSFICG